MIRNTALFPRLAFLLTSTACSNVSVGADNRYGFSWGEAVVRLPIESVPEKLLLHRDLRRRKNKGSSSTRCFAGTCSADHEPIETV